jgi:hypothetical protein
MKGPDLYVKQEQGGKKKADIPEDEADGDDVDADDSQEELEVAEAGV